MTAGRGVCLVAALCLSCATAACVSESGTAAESAEAAGEAEAPQPALATYRCDDDTAITIENSAGAVRVTAADGETLDLPASPPGQRSRYGHTIYALVLEGQEALYMRGNDQPRTCLR